MANEHEPEYPEYSPYQPQPQPPPYAPPTHPPPPPAPIPLPGAGAYTPPDLRGLGPKPTYANEYINAEEDLDRAADEQIDSLVRWLRYRGPKWLFRICVVIFVIIVFRNQAVWSKRFSDFLSGNPIIGMIFQLMFAVTFMAVQFGAFFFLMGRPRVTWMKPGEGGIGFKDYKGNPEVLEGARRVVVLLQGAKEFKQMGGEVIRGLLLEGPPGTGKSYLAQAISTEAKIPFCYCSAPSLIGVFIGMGPLQASMIYRKARKQAMEWGACIVFFDEIDAIAQSRMGAGGMGGIGGGGMMGGMMGGGGGVLNTLLTNMDPMPREYVWWRSLLRALHIIRGKAQIPPVLTIGATNISSTLDPALLRPGRFDRKIHVDLPDADGRREVIDYYLAKVKHDPMPIDRMISDTIGYTPVAIKYVINEAVVHAHFDGRTSINYWDFSRARDTHEHGLRQPRTTKTYRDNSITAYHEAGHAYSQVVLRPHLRITKVTILRHGDAEGFVSMKQVDESHTKSRDEYLADIQVSLAGRAAEEVFFGEQFMTMGGDLPQANRSARIVVMFGFDGTFYSIGPDVVPDADQKKRIEKVLQEEYKKVKRLLTEHRAVVDAIAQELLVRHELTDYEVLDIIKRFEPLPKEYGRDGEMPMVYNEPQPQPYPQPAAYAPPIPADGD